MINPNDVPPMPDDDGGWADEDPIPLNDSHGASG
jgi:hypothetical protein